MARKWIEKKSVATLILPVSIALITVISGCGAQSGTPLNPYQLLTKIDSVDHTNFFVSTYSILTTAGLGFQLTDNQTQQLQQLTSTSTTIPGLQKSRGR